MNWVGGKYFIKTPVGLIECEGKHDEKQLWGIRNDLLGGTEYRVTCLPSGFSLPVTFKTYESAQTCVEAIADATDWATLTPTNFQERFAEGSPAREAVKAAMVKLGQPTERQQVVHILRRKG